MGDTLIPHSEGPVICYECRKRITSRLYWRHWDNGKIVFICNKCAAAMVDEHGINGLMFVQSVEDPDESEYEFQIQAARKGEE